MARVHHTHLVERSAETLIESVLELSCAVLDARHRTVNNFEFVLGVAVVVFRRQKQLLLRLLSLAHVFLHERLELFIFENCLEVVSILELLLKFDGSLLQVRLQVRFALIYVRWSLARLFCFLRLLGLAFGLLLSLDSLDFLGSPSKHC